MSEIRSVGIVGAGTMGCGIAQLLVQNRLNVVLMDVSDEILANAESRILEGLKKTESAGAMIHLSKTTRMEDLASCDLVIEAVVEKLSVKQDVFRRLDVLLPPPALLATNTSSLLVTAIAAETKYPGRVLGLHFFNPTPVMRLVEVIQAKNTSDETVRRGLDFADHIGKTAIVCKDTPGFITNRVARPFFLTAMRFLERGAGTPAQIDAAMRTHGGFKMGPLQVIDLIGMEVNLSISQQIYEALGSPERLKPCEIQARLVARGCLGRKASRGFYVYSPGVPPAINPLLGELLPGMGSSPLPPDKIFEEILGDVVKEARRVAMEGVSSEKDIDTAVCLGLNWMRGPLAWDELLARRS